MSIFACIYGFSIAVVQKTQFMHYSHDSEHKEHALSNVCYSIPLHLSHAPLHVIHRICNELQKKKPCEMLAWHKEFWFSQEIPPVICVRLSKNRDRLWQFYTAPDGKQSFPPSHWLQAWHSIETFTQIHTRIREHFHPIGTALANQYARKPQGLVLHCFQLGQTRATVKFTVPPEGRQRSIQETNRNGKLVAVSQQIYPWGTKITRGCTILESHSVAVDSTMLNR